MIRWGNSSFPPPFTVKVLEAEADYPAQDESFWRDRPMAERTAAIEFLRQQFFAPYDPARDRVQRTIRIVEPFPG